MNARKVIVKLKLWGDLFFEGNAADSVTNLHAFLVVGDTVTQSATVFRHDVDGTPFEHLAISNGSDFRRDQVAQRDGEERLHSLQIEHLDVIGGLLGVVQTLQGSRLQHQFVVGENHMADGVAFEVLQVVFAADVRHHSYCNLAVLYFGV